MSVLWTFGDSFTFGHGCRKDCHNNSYYLKYRKEDDDIWSNHLSKYLNFEVKNFGKNGASNDYIFDSIIKNYDSINENDIVIIGKTIYGRIEIPNSKKEWVSVFSDIEGKSNWWYEQPLSDFSVEELETIINFQYFFSTNELYKIRHDDRFNFLKNRLINDKKIESCFVWQIEDRELMNNFQTINTATKNEIKDFHFSFKGHLDFATFLFSKLRKPNKLL